MDTSLRIGDHLMSLEQPVVMGILNATPDSFFAGSRTPVDDGAEALVERARRLLDEGATILDLGAVSTRPDSEPASEDEEMRRLAAALEPLRKALPEAVVSVDTFRASVARRVVRDFGAAIINDVSGCVDPEMLATVAELQVPYVLTHNPSAAAGGTAQINAFTSAAKGLDADSHETAVKPVDVQVAQFFAWRLQEMYDAGAADVILDPGFGFGKTMAENFALMAALPRLVRLFPQTPFLVGIARKSMIYRLLGTSPEASLNGTSVLNTLSLQAGAHILRVHDVREAVEAVKLVQASTSDIQH